MPGWLHWPVTSVRFMTGMCPPFARCGPTRPDQGWVVFTFSIGDPSMVHVTTDEGGALIAGDPEALPEWLLEDTRNPQQAPTQPFGAGG